MSNRATTSSETKRRLYRERDPLTPKDKRIGTAAIQKMQGKTIEPQKQKDQANKKMRTTMTKQELMKQHTELLEELQNARLQLEEAKNEQKKLKKALNNLRDSFDEKYPDDSIDGEDEEDEEDFED